MLWWRSYRYKIRHWSRRNYITNKSSNISSKNLFKNPIYYLYGLFPTRTKFIRGWSTPYNQFSSNIIHTCRRLQLAQFSVGCFKTKQKWTNPGEHLNEPPINDSKHQHQNPLQFLLSNVIKLRLGFLFPTTLQFSACSYAHRLQRKWSQASADSSIFFYFGRKFIK